MRMSGLNIVYADGTKVIRSGRAVGTTASINHALDASERRQRDEQALIDNFIPSHLFVGAEKALQAAMRQLITDRDYSQ